VSFACAFNASKTITADCYIAGKTIDFTGATGSPTLSTSASQLIIGGSVTLIESMTMTHNNKLWAIYNDETAYLDTAGKTIYRVTINQEQVILSSDLNQVSVMNVGASFDANDYNVKASAFTSTNGKYTTTREVKMGNGTWEAYTYYTSTLNYVWWWQHDQIITPEGSTIKITDASANAKVFAGLSKTFNNLWITGAGTGGYTITGTNTFNEFKDDNTSAHSITFPNVTTTVDSFPVKGADGDHKITLQRTGGSGTWTIAKSGEGVNTNCDYLSISNSTATPADTFFAGNNSTDGGGNTDWTFTEAPSPSPSASPSLSPSASPSLSLSASLSVSPSISPTPSPSPIVPIKPIIKITSIKPRTWLKP
jgi:hypothetical protein